MAPFAPSADERSSNQAATCAARRADPAISVRAGPASKSVRPPVLPAAPERGTPTATGAVAERVTRRAMSWSFRQHARGLTAGGTSSNTFLSWRRCRAGISSPGKTFIIATGSGMTTVLRTWSSGQAFSHQASAPSAPLPGREILARYEGKLKTLGIAEAMDPRFG